jgi:hypothetical protein
MAGAVGDRSTGGLGVIVEGQQIAIGVLRVWLVEHRAPCRQGDRVWVVEAPDPLERAEVVIE